MTSAQAQKPDKPAHETTYEVDGEQQTTTEKELSVRQILENAGNDPAKHYLLELRPNGNVEHRNLDEVIKLHNKMRFAAIFTGETPVS